MVVEVSTCRLAKAKTNLGPKQHDKSRLGGIGESRLDWDRSHMAWLCMLATRFFLEVQTLSDFFRGGILAGNCLFSFLSCSTRWAWTHRASVPCWSCIPSFDTYHTDRIWMAPFCKLLSLVQHDVHCRQLPPSNTSACILVPGYMLNHVAIFLSQLPSFVWH